MEVEGVANRKSKGEPVCDPPGSGLDTTPHIGFRLRVQKRIDDAAPGERGIQEWPICMTPLRTERRIHEDGLEGLMDSLDVGEAPFDVDVCAFRVSARDIKDRRIRINAHDTIGAEKFRGNRENTVPASEVYRCPTRDIPFRMGDVHDLRRNPRRRRILLRRGCRVGQRVEGLQDSLELDFLRGLTPSSSRFNPRPTSTLAL